MGGENPKDVALYLVNTGYAVNLAENEKLDKSELNRKYEKKMNLDEVYQIPFKQSSYASKRPEYASQTSLPQANQKNIRNYNNRRNYDENDDENDDSMSSISRLSGLNSTCNSSLVSDNSSRLDALDNDENSFAGYDDLRGPYSPLECNYFSLINAGHTKRVGLERESINYVTIDEDPLNNSTRLMVASAISLNQSGTNIIARKTCLMPKMPGLSSICCLLFSPCIEIRVDDKENFFTGALCGLGYDELNRAPIYIDNDIECIFDSKIDMRDFSMINDVRMSINMVIGCEKEVESWT